MENAKSRGGNGTHFSLTSKNKNHSQKVCFLLNFIPKSCMLLWSDTILLTGIWDGHLVNLFWQQKALEEEWKWGHKVKDLSLSSSYPLLTVSYQHSSCNWQQCSVFFSPSPLLRSNSRNRVINSLKIWAPYPWGPFLNLFGSVKIFVILRYYHLAHLALKYVPTLNEFTTLFYQLNCLG